MLTKDEPLLSAYAYAANQPTTQTDPSGMTFVPSDIGQAAAENAASSDDARACCREWSSADSTDADAFAPESAQRPRLHTDAETSAPLYFWIRVNNNPPELLGTGREKVDIDTKG
jgi:hypothetical protein